MKNYIFFALLLFAVDIQAIIVDYVILKSPDGKKTIYLFGDIHIPHEGTAQEQASALKCIINKMPDASLHIDGCIDMVKNLEQMKQPDYSIDVSVVSFVKAVKEFQGKSSEQTILNLSESIEQTRKIQEDNRVLLSLNLVKFDSFEQKIDYIQSKGLGVSLDGLKEGIKLSIKSENEVDNLFDLQVLNDALSTDTNAVIAICGTYHVYKIMNALLHLKYIMSKNILFPKFSYDQRYYVSQIKKLIKLRINTFFIQLNASSFYTKTIIYFKLIWANIPLSALEKEIQDERYRQLMWEGFLKIWTPLCFEELMIAAMLDDTQAIC